MIASEILFYSQFYSKYDEKSYFDFLAQKFDSPELQTISSTIPNGIWSSIQQKVFYILLRHKYWAHCPILLDAAEEYLISEYKISREIIKKLLDLTFGFVADFFREYAEACSQEKEFLLYIFLECTLHKSEGQLLISLGLGRSLIDKIHKAVDIASAIQLAEASAPLQFLPRLDALVAELLLEFESECLDSSKKLACYRVKYSMLKGSWFLPFFHNAEFIEALTGMLIDLATARPMTQQALQMRMADLCERYLSAVQRELIDDLIRIGFLYAHSAGSKREARVELTPLAKGLVASTIVSVLIDTKKLDSSSLAKIDDIFLNEYLNSQVMDLERLENLVLKCRPISPRILDQALQIIKNQTSIEYFGGIIQSLNSRENSFLLQKVVSRYVMAITPNPVVIDQSGSCMAEFLRLSDNTLPNPMKTV